MEKIRQIKEIAKRLEDIKNKKGMNMEDFNFDELDALLDETETKEVKDEQTDDNTNDDALLDELVHMDDSNAGDDDNINEVIPEPEPEVDYNTIIKELENTIAELQGQLKATEVAKTQETIDQASQESFDDLEFADETRAFLKEHAALEVEKLEINQQIKDLKKDYEDQGVHTKEALKAWKEYQKQLKETADEAQEIENIKRLINQDDTLSSTAVALVD
jgi:hypothetical protein